MKAGASQTALYQLYAELFKTQSEDQIKEWGDKMYHAELQAKQVLVVPLGFLVLTMVSGDGKVAGIRKSYCSKGVSTEQSLKSLSEVLEVPNVKEWAALCL